MSDIQRYRINPMAWKDGKGFVPAHRDRPLVIAQEQRHKKGGWCKWDDVKKLQAQVDELEKLLDDFDGSVRHMITAAPQLNEILKRNMRRMKSGGHHGNP